MSASRSLINWRRPSRYSARSRRILRLTAALAIFTAILVTALWPVSTAVGVNYTVTVQRLTLFEKVVAFVDRDLELRRLTQRVGGTDGSPETRLLRMFYWVTENIHSVPQGLPVIDDHVLSIFTRRYGADDQRAEALAALASYDDLPAATVALGRDPKRRFVQLTVVRLSDGVVAFDVNNRIVFRRSSGKLATLHDLVTEPSIVRTAGEGVIVDGSPYHEHFVRLGDVVPNFLRMEQQRFWSRLKIEVSDVLFGS